MDQGTSWFAVMMVNIVYAALIMTAGYWAAKIVAGFIRGLMEKREIDQALTSFVCNLANAAIIVFAAIAALNELGIETTSLVAVVGAAGLAIGLALKDSLGNFASGVMILIFRQFRSGDLIEAAGVIGVVESLNLFSTQLKTGDNKTVFVPNGKLVGDNIINYSMKGTRRLDLVIGVSYSADLGKARDLLQDILADDERILKDPSPTIGVLALGESSVDFAVRPWVNVDDYWAVHFALHQEIKQRFDAAGIGIPFPQRDVHIHQASA